MNVQMPQIAPVQQHMYGRVDKQQKVVNDMCGEIIEAWTWQVHSDTK